ncbi:MAG: sigma 54-interacting transcriptional regulator [Nitrospira sp.]|nr:sigma 54-interacting transcriptional regulator [Nitrospira sp.]
MVEMEVECKRENRDRWVEVSVPEKDLLKLNHRTAPLSVVEARPLTTEDSTTPLSITGKLYLSKLIGDSPNFMAAKTQAVKVARYEVSVLILGETGTGKELFARAIHYLSARADRPFIPVNCGAIPLDLIENELFGHEAGAFTGASSTKRGLIQEANGGTLFLDEVDSLPLLAQVKLLRFLQDQEYRPVGSTKLCHADLRVIAATNASITNAIADGKFRQDLYYRLNTIPLVLPRLRERPEDIPLLVSYFMKKYAQEYKKQITGFSASAYDMLLHYDWPGNVRELEHIIARAAVFAQSPTIETTDLLMSVDLAPSMNSTFSEAKAVAVTQFERAYLHQLLTTYQGNISRAAVAAQKDRRVLRDLIHKHNIDASRFRPSLPG